jgi:hypothetical protein
MSKRTFSWKTQLEYGLEAQARFHDIYHEPLILADTLRYDFKRVKDGKKLELKTDDWDHNKTENFFFERYSVWEKESPGGPWQSRKHSVDLFVYYFARNQVYYEFSDVKKLCKELERIVRREKLGLVMIRNNGYNTAGYKVKREWVLDLCDVYEVE